MARQWRIEYEGALYHVLSRGNERRPIVSDDADRTLFLNTLGRMCSRYEVEVYAFVLMDNHYHLLLQTRRANLSRSLQWLGLVYSSHYNVSHQRSGHLFQGRFKSFLIEDDSYLMTLSCYIHRNPLRAKLVERLADYRWSSYPAYVYGQSQPDWLNVELILSQLPGQDKRQAYRQKVQEYASEESNLWEELRHGLFFGSQDFIDRIKSSFGVQSPHPELPQQKRLLKEQALEGVVAKIAAACNWDARELLQSPRGRGIRHPERDLVIYALWESGLYSNQQIGQHFGISYSAISRQVSTTKLLLEQDQAFRSRLAQLRSQLKM